MDKISRNLQTLENQMKKKDENITNSIAYHCFKGPINSLVRISKNISIQKNEPSNYFDVFNYLQKLSMKIVENISYFPSDFNDYCFLNPSLKLSPKALRQRDFDALEKKLKTSLAEYLTQLSFYGNYSGAFDDLIRHHNDFMLENNLAPLTTSESKLLEDFDTKHNSVAPLHQTLVKSLFWTNKMVKYIDNSLPATLLFASNIDMYHDLNYDIHDKFTEDDKYISICKANFWRSTYNELETNLLPPNVTFNHLAIFFDSIEHFEEYDTNPKLKELLRSLPNIPQDVLQQLIDVSRRYNQIFKNNTPNTNFGNDIFYVANTLTTKTQLYSIKNELTKSVINTINLDTVNPTKKILHYGVEYDYNNSPVLDVELPGYIGRTAVHMPFFLLEDPTIKASIDAFPEYLSFINTSHIIFPASEQQKKWLKSELSNAKTQNNQARYNLITQYYGMSTGNYSDFLKAHSKSQTK